MTDDAPIRLIVNADDFGLTPGVNQGTIRAHEEGIVTSATLMVRWPAAEDAARYARRNPDLAVGLHFDLGEWAYRDGQWYARYEVVPTDDEPAVDAELNRQLAMFERLIGRPPTHLDSHQHVHRDPVVGRLLAGAGRRLGVAVRGLSPQITYRGDFYGQDERGEPIPDAISVGSLVALIRSVPPGVTELACHPGEGDIDSTYRYEREREVEALCDQRVVDALAAAGVRLCSFADVPNAPFSTP